MAFACLQDILNTTTLSEHHLNDLERTKLAATLYEEMRTRKMAPDNELFGRLVNVWTEQVRKTNLLMYPSRYIPL